MILGLWSPTAGACLGLRTFTEGPHLGSHHDQEPLVDQYPVTIPPPPQGISKAPWGVGSESKSCTLMPPSIFRCSFSPLHSTVPISLCGFSSMPTPPSPQSKRSDRAPESRADWHIKWLVLCKRLVRTSTIDLPISSALLPPGKCHTETKQALFSSYMLFSMPHIIL